MSLSVFATDPHCNTKPIDPSTSEITDIGSTIVDSACVGPKKVGSEQTPRSGGVNSQQWLRQSDVAFWVDPSEAGL